MAARQVPAGMWRRMQALQLHTLRPARPAGSWRRPLAVPRHEQRRRSLTTGPALGSSGPEPAAEDNAAGGVQGSPAGKEEDTLLITKLTQTPSVPRMPFAEAVRVLKAFAIQPQTVTLQFKTDTTDKAKKKKQPRDPIQAVTVLPHPLRPNRSVAVFAEGRMAEEAQAAGATVVGTTELMAQVLEGDGQYDAYLASFDQLKKIKPLAKVLRRKMPSEKAGTVTDRFDEAVPRFATGVPLISNKRGDIFVAIGKTTFPDEQLLANVEQVWEDLDLQNTSNVPRFVLSARLSSDQGLGIPIETAPFKKK